MSNSSFSGNLLPPPSSFSENLLPPPSSFSASKAIEQLCGKDVLDEIEKREGKGTEGERVRVEPGPETASSTPDSEFSEGESSRQRRRKEKRHRKRKKEEKEEERKRRKKRKQTGDELQIGSLEAQSVDRKAAVKAWADGKENVAKEYYMDTRGDRDNLAFGSLYRSAQQWIFVVWRQDQGFRKSAMFVPKSSSFNEEVRWSSLDQIADDVQKYM